jgi:hypothetical protein
MYGMTDSYFAEKQTQYLRDVVLPRGGRNHYLLSELDRSRKADEATQGPRPKFWTGPLAFVRSAFTATERAFGGGGSRRPTQRLA